MCDTMYSPMLDDDCLLFMNRVPSADRASHLDNAVLIDNHSGCNRLFMPGYRTSTAEQGT